MLRLKTSHSSSNATLTDQPFLPPMLRLHTSHYSSNATPTDQPLFLQCYAYTPATSSNTTPTDQPFLPPILRLQTSHSFRQTMHLFFDAAHRHQYIMNERQYATGVVDVPRR